MAEDKYPEVKDGMVRVMLYTAEYESPYSWEWTDHPFSEAGYQWKEWLNTSFWISVEQYRRWAEAEIAFYSVRDELDRIMEARASGG